MQFTKLKRINAIQLEVKDTKVVWFIDLVSSPKDIEEKIPAETNLVLVHKSQPFADPAEVEEWDLFSQRMKAEKNVVVVFSSGEYRVLDVHMKGSSLDSMVHYVLETPDGSVGFFQGEPSDSFIKQYSPIDVIVGRDTALASVQLDLEPFYVILATFAEDYKKKSGITDISSTDKVTVKHIDAAAREGAVSMNVYAL